MRLEAPQAPTGTKVGRYLMLLVKANECIEAVSLMKYEMPPTLQMRLPEFSDAWAIADEALNLREATSMPFWDAAMLRCFENGSKADDLLKAGFLHNPAQRNRWLVNRDAVEQLHTACGKQDEGIAFCSELMIAGSRRFMPLIDFHCPESNENDRLVRGICALLAGCDIAVFRSGKSYHAYALCTATQDELRQFLYRALLFAPVVDRAYVAHQLIEGCCALRISATQTKPIVPEFKFLIHG